MHVVLLAVSFVLALATSLTAQTATPPPESPASTPPQETKPVDKNSVRVVVTGCLKGRVLRTTASREVDVSSPIDLAGRSFRLAGPKPVMADVKKHDGDLVEIVGLVKKSDLPEPGMKLGSSRVVIGAGPMSSDPTRNPARDPLSYVAMMDASSVRWLEDGCSLVQK